MRQDLQQIQLNSKVITSITFVLKIHYHFYTINCLARILTLLWLMATMSKKQNALKDDNSSPNDKIEISS